MFLRTFKLLIQDWINAAQAVMCRFILFNKRRVSKVEELKMKDLNDSVNANASDSEDILAQMDFTERALAKRMKVIEVRGKGTRGIRKVFIILSKQMSKACFHLLTIRPSVPTFICLQGVKQVRWMGVRQCVSYQNNVPAFRSQRESEQDFFAST